MKKACLFALVLTGCTTAAPVYLADGSKGFNISCGGAVQSFGDCHAKAGEICGSKGYEVVNREGDAVPYAIATAGYSAAQGAYQSQAGAIVTRNLFVRCK